MGVEIERKFLVLSNDYRQQATDKTLYKQGYLKNSGKSVVRVRVAGTKAYITIKGESKNISRAEFEYKIPVADANAMLQLCEGSIIEKYRYIVPSGNGRFGRLMSFWEIMTGLLLPKLN